MDIKTKTNIEKYIETCQSNLDLQIEQLNNWKTFWNTDWIGKLHIEEYATLKLVYHESQIVKLQNQIANYKQQLKTM